MTLRRLAIGTIGFLAISSWMRAQCGAERRDIKSGFDPGAAAIALANPTATTIEAISAFPQPNPIPATSRVSPAETTAWTLEATLEAFKLEGGPKGDHDYDLVLSDAAGKTSREISFWCAFESTVRA